MSRLQSIASIVFIGYCIPAVLGFFGYWWWVFDLFSHFRFQYVWLGFLLLPIAVSLRCKVHAWIIAGVLAVHAVLLLPMMTVGPHASIPHKNEVTRIMFGNIHYKTVDVQAVARSVHQVRPDVLVLAEIQPDDFAALLPLIPQFAVVHQFPAFGAFDLAVLSITSLATQPEIFLHERLIPWVEFGVPVGSNQITVFGVHPYPPIGSVTTTSRDTYLEAVFAKASQAEHSLVIGDFNITSFSPKFADWLVTYGLTDTQIEFGLQPSWPTWLPAFMRIPIDHVVVSREVMVKSRWLAPDTGSDHLPVVVDVWLE